MGYIPEPVRFDFTSAQAWSVAHLSGRPTLFKVYNDSNEEIVGAYEYIDDNNFNIKFNEPIAGYVMVR
jgi:hypothetical protein